MNNITWFERNGLNSICSWCGGKIKSDFVPYKLMNASQNKEALFHFACGIDAGVIPEIGRLLLNEDDEQEKGGI